MLNSLENNSHVFAAGGIGSLGIDPKLLILQIITFVIILLILKKYAFGPIIQALENRYEKIEGSIKHAESLEEANAEAAKEAEELLKKARAEAEEIIGKSHEEAGAVIEAAEEKASGAADKFLASARKTLDQDVMNARRQIKGEMVELVSGVSESILGEKLTSAKDKQLVESTLAGSMRGVKDD